MSAPDEQWQPGFLLHARAYRETSLLSDWHIAERGRVGAILRGARRKSGTLPQVFQPYFVMVVGQGELKQISKFEPSAGPLLLRGQALFAGMYLNELQVRLLPRELPQPELFVSYAWALGELAQTQEVATIASILRRFERQLLITMGQWGQLDHCAVTQTPLNAQGYYQFYPEHGWVPAKAGQRGACLGEDILAVLAEDFSTLTRQRLAKAIMQSALQPLLGGRPLKSRELFRANLPDSC